MRPRILAAVFLLLCFASSAKADQMFGEFHAAGVGATEAIAAEGAWHSLDEFVTAWESELKPGQEILVVVGSTNWDLPEYEISFWIIVLDVGI